MTKICVQKYCFAFHQKKVLDRVRDLKFYGKKGMSRCVFSGPLHIEDILAGGVAGKNRKNMR
jgi:hypothetical protein